MPNVFLYPLHQTFKGSPNPYMHHFKGALEKKAIVVNAGAIHRGVLNLYLYFFKADIFILNWIEFLAEKRFGRIQVQLFILFCRLASLFGKKIIWVLHNKGSHHGGFNSKTEKMFQVLMEKSNHILTHSLAGIEFVKEKYPFASDKVEALVHPVEPPFGDSDQEEKLYDILIWGSVHPYKGIDLFLDFIQKSAKFHKYKILIIGKCFDQDYKNKILKYTTKNIVYRDKIYSIEQISDFATKSKFVLFTYKSKTIISSGALMDTLRMHVQVIGPDYAAFKDLNRLSCINTYNSFENIYSILENYDTTKNLNFTERERFHKENSWESFVEKISHYF